MSSIFPFLDVPPEELAGRGTELPLFKEYAWDFERDEFMLKDGNPVLLEGIDGLKVWIYKALRTERYRYLAYSWDYGNEVERLIGSTYTPAAQQSEAERYIREALLVLPYIEEVRNVEIRSLGDMLQIDFKVDTVYGEVSLHV